MDMTRRDFIASAAGGIALLAIGRRFALGSDGTRKHTGEELAKMKAELVSRMKDYGAYEVRIADPALGFKHGLAQRHPQEIWPECKSVICVVVPNPPDETFIPEGERNEEDIRRIESDVSPGNTRIRTIHRLVLPVMSKAVPAGVSYLLSRGFKVFKSGMNPEDKESGNKKQELQYKMCAYEAGVGVYGRAGFLMHPELGNRMCIMVLMTDAVLPPDDKPDVTLKCDDCGKCVKSCLAGAYDLKKKYPESYTGQTCAMHRHKMLMTKGTLCQNCFASCPACKKSDKELEEWLKAKAVEVDRTIKASPEGRLPGKVEKFHEQFKKWREAGNDPAPVVRIMKDLESTLKQGKHAEAEALIDRAMKIFEPTSRKAERL